MDPNATLARIAEIVASNGGSATREELMDEELDNACNDLHEWLAKGGFAPRWDASQCGTVTYLDWKSLNSR